MSDVLDHEGVAMDAGALATEAVDLTGSYPEDGPAGAGRVRELVADRLRRTLAGAAALSDLENQPDDPAARHAVAALLAEDIAHDEQFTAELGRAVRDAQWTTRRSFRMGTKGWLAAIAAGGVAVAGLVVFVGSGDSGSGDRGGTPGTSAVPAVGGMPKAGGGVPGTSGESEARAVAEGFIAAMAARDFPRACTFIVPGERDEGPVEGELCERTLADMLPGMEPPGGWAGARVARVESAPALADGPDAGRESVRAVFAQRVLDQGYPDDPDGRALYLARKEGKWYLRLFGRE